MNDYLQDERLASYLWEESYVLSITAEPASLTLIVDLALRTSHPLHQSPRANERHCYMRGRLGFSRVKDLSWTGQGAVPAVDATGEVDFGTVDTFEVDAGTYVLNGDFGRIAVLAADCEVALEENLADGPA